MEVWSVSRPVRFTPGETVPSTHSTGGWVDSRVGQGALEKRKISFPGRESNHGRPARSPSICRQSYPGSSSQVYYFQTKRKQLFIHGHTGLHLLTVTTRAVHNSCQCFQIAQYAGDETCQLLPHLFLRGYWTDYFKTEDLPPSFSYWLKQEANNWKTDFINIHVHIHISDIW
jgi:hypothetical protein